MRKIFNGLFLIFIFMFLFSYQNIYAFDELGGLSSSSSSTQNDLLYNRIYSSNEYYINKYHVDINVNENNSFDITENITAYFNVSKHGIYRKIPLVNTVVRNDGTTSKNRARITTLKVSEEFTKSVENNNYVIKIGSPDYTLTGNKTYNISYNYNIGKDPLKDSDEFYFNIIGDEWDTIIGNVSFKITMPKEFDSSKLGFSTGRTGTIGSNKVTYKVDGNVITGTYNGTLSGGEALTVRLGLDEGYFTYVSSYTAIDYIFYIFPVVFVLIVFLLWLKYGKDNHVVETVEFYPPEGFNSLEVGFLYKGHADNKDVVSLLIYLANKGYIKIDEFDERALFSTTKSFKITKLKEYDGNNINERLFLQGLFRKKLSSSVVLGNILGNSLSQEENNPNEVCARDLYDNFYMTSRQIVRNMDAKENKQKIFEKSSLSKKVFIVLMIIATFIFITVRPVYLYGGFEILLFALLFPGIGFSFLIGMIVNGKDIFTRIFAVIWGLGFGGIPFFVMVFPLIRYDTLYLVGYLVGLVCITLLIIFLRIMPKRTKYGNEMLGKISGFKNFLETAEKSRLEALVMENPTYFYDILPYTYVLEVSDKWIKKFESITMEAPSWYGGSGTFNMVSFGSFMDSTMKSAERNMSSSSSSSSSGGGGSSGGGSGGGGGGSW